MSALVLLLGCDAALLALSLVAIVVAKSRNGGVFIYGAAFAICSALLAGGGIHLLGRHAPEGLTLPIGLPWIGANFRLDALSAFFVDGGQSRRRRGEPLRARLRAPRARSRARAAVLSGVSGRHESRAARGRRLHLPVVVGVHVARLLGAGDGASPRIRQPARGLRLYRHGELRHAVRCCSRSVCSPERAAPIRSRRCARRARRREWPPWRLVLALAGAGSKAGLAPLHVWLPLAHPAAPSHVSALMSGVMTKVAIYAFIRIVFDLAGPADWRWSVPVLAIGAATGLIGVAERADADRSQARARLLDDREHRPRLHRSGPRARLQGERHGRRGGAGDDGGAVSFAQSRVVQEPAVSRRGRGADRRPGSGEWIGSAACSTACRRRASSCSSAAPRFQRCRRSTASFPSG